MDYMSIKVANPNEVDFHSVYSKEESNYATLVSVEQKTEALKDIRDKVYSAYKTFISEQDNPALVYLMHPYHYVPTVNDSGLIEYNPSKSIKHRLLLTFKKADDLTAQRNAMDVLFSALKAQVVDSDKNPSVPMDVLKSAFNDVCKCVHENFYVRKVDIRAVLCTTLVRKSLKIKDVLDKQLDLAISIMLAGALQNVDLTVNKAKKVTEKATSTTTETK